MDTYNPDIAPDPDVWLALDEGERIHLVGVAHEGERLKDESADRLHALFHTVVETQLAEGQPPAVRRTMERFQARGVSRHQTLHAIASVLAPLMVEVMQDEVTMDLERYERRLDALKHYVWNR